MTTSEPGTAGNGRMSLEKINDDVKVFKEGTYKLVWGIGGPQTRWIRGEDIVRG